MSTWMWLLLGISLLIRKNEGGFAILTRHFSGTFGGEWDTVPQVRGTSNKYAQSGCPNTVGKTICWNKTPPVHVSDGGGPQDQVRQNIVQKQLENIVNHMSPKFNYHPIALPKNRDANPDPQTLKMLDITHRLLNQSNPSLAQNCWLCLHLGLSMPISININSIELSSNNCMPIMPLPVQPIFSEAPCIVSPYRDDSYAIDIGILSLTNFTDIINITYSPCAPNDMVFVCGNNLAYTILPTNWTGLCTIALLLTDIDIVNGNESLPIPSFDYISGCSRGVIQFLPLLATLGITAGMATGTADMVIAVHKYTELSQLMAEDIQALSGTVKDLQVQLNSLAEVSLSTDPRAGSKEKILQAVRSSKHWSVVTPRSIDQPVYYKDNLNNQWIHTTVVKWGRGFSYISTGDRNFWVPDKNIKLRSVTHEETMAEKPDEILSEQISPKIPVPNLDTQGQEVQKDDISAPRNGD
ncbi:syncytin-1-like [Nycticebus coucang]|uniref:syncytin-1-like n=1 Tax=Nycticebus coucang TaxID=9470 RepID=UPI00234DF099|nr:syncytin-1-like [Nycticebus coucang]